MNIIGHRGAAGLELENTEASIRRALSFDLAAVEIDVRMTKDRRLAVCHDSDLVRIAGDHRQVRNLTLRQLKDIPLVNGSETLSLPEALKIIGDNPVMVEIKDHGSARQLVEVLEKFPKANVSAVSFKLDELALLRDLAPDMTLYALDHTKPFDVIHLARILKLSGIGLNYWVLNPLTYWYARRSKLKIYVYTVNSKFRAKFISWFYPDVAICTDHPEWFVKERRKRHTKKKKARARASQI